MSTERCSARVVAAVTFSNPTPERLHGGAYHESTPLAKPGQMLEEGEKWSELGPVREWRRTTQSPRTSGRRPFWKSIILQPVTPLHQEKKRKQGYKACSTLTFSTPVFVFQLPGAPTGHPL